MQTTLAQAGSFFANGGGLFAAGLAAVSVPIAIHLLTRMQRVAVPWGAMKFLMEAYKRHRTRLNLEQLILLLIRCLILAALGFALAGPRPRGVAQGLGLSSGYRTVCIVIDDSLSTRATSGGKSRFDDLKEQAEKFLDTLSPTDRVAIWTGARPAEELLIPATLDHAGARTAIQTLQPRYTASALPGALRAVTSYLSKHNEPAEQVYVVVLSDFAEDALPTDTGTVTELAKLGELSAKLLVLPPASSLPNAQVMSLLPRRHMVVVTPDQAAPAIPLSIKLRRFVEDETTIQSTKVQLFVHDYDAGGEGDAAAQAGRPLIGPITRELRWTPGQPTGGWDNLELPLDELPNLAAMTDLREGQAVGPGGGRRLVVRAVVDDDALASDNTRYAVVELRSRLGVGIIDQPRSNVGGAPAGDAAAKLAPYQWVRLAFRVGRNGVKLFPPSDLREEELRLMDSVVVMRPDLLGDRDWQLLRKLAERGGMVWVFPPVQSADAQWAERFTRAMKLRWRVALESKRADDEQYPGGVSLNINTSTPSPLRLLAADWQDLLRPIRVNRWYPITIEGGADRVWLRMANAEAANANGGANAGTDGAQGNSENDGAGTRGDRWLVAGDVGDGKVCLFASALDASWTNLSTKPLFVPLMNEGLRGVLGNAGEAKRLAGLVCGDQPALGKAWDGAQKLVRRAGVEAAGGQTTARSVPLQRTDDGFTPLAPMDEPGVYVATPEAQGRKLAVNVEAHAGDTRAVSEQRLRDWFNGMGGADGWTFLDRNDLAGAMSTEVARANIGWHLLWLVLALVITELFLARWFAHAKEQRTRPRFNRILGSVLGAEAIKAASAQAGAKVGAKGGRG